MQIVVQCRKLVSLLVLTGLCFSAGAEVPDEKKISVNLTNVSLEEVIWDIQKKSDFVFMYGTKVIEKVKNLNVKFSNTEVSKILDHCLKQTGLKYEISGNAIVIKQSKEAQPEKVTINGAVRDVNGEPVAGAAVLVKGTVKGITTDSDGNFSLEVKEGVELKNGRCTLIFSFLGMETQEIEYRGQQKISVVMIDAAAQVEELVVTGVYQRKKESFTGSSSTFKSADLKLVGSQNVLQSLKTLDPSFSIIENNLYGSDPNRLPDVEVRGKTSIVGLMEEYSTNPNQPLFILDGFESSLRTINDLSMDRVESITVLKDAAATAIYGSKAANGVIVVETKRPEPGKLKTSYFGNFSVSFADLTDYNLMNSSEKLEFEKLSGYFGDLDNNNNIVSESFQIKYNDILAEIRRGVDTYWLNEPLRVAFTQKHSLYVEGGDDAMVYGIGLSYGNTEGVMKESGRDVVNGNIRMIYRKKSFSFSNNLNLDYTNADKESVPFSRYARTNPYFRKYNESGEPEMLLTSIEYKDNTTLRPTIKEFYNPLYDREQNNYNQADIHGFTDNIELEWRVIEGLRARARLGLGWSSEKGEIFRSPYLSDFVETERLNKGRYTESVRTSMNYNGDAGLTYAKFFADKHAVNAVLGMRISDDKVKYSQYSVRGFIDDEFRNPSFAMGYPEGEKSGYYQTQKRSSSLYFNAGYSFDNRYLADFNYRYDGSSVFGADRHFSNTWSVGLGWNLHKESFMKNLKWMDLLKLRASIGNPGNQNFDDYISMRIYGYNNMYSSPFGATVIVTNFGNRDLDWQQTIDFNAGFDLILLNNRMRCYFDYFNKVTDPLLVSIGVPESTGTSSILRNLGAQQTKGLTMVLNYAVIKTDNMIWSFNVDLRHLKTRYRDIGNSLEIYNNANKSRNLTRYYDGGSPSDLWAVVSNGIDPMTGREVFVKKNGMQTFRHDYKDEIICGNSEPDLEGVIGTSFFYKGFSASVNLRYRTGGQIFLNTLYSKVENITTEKILENQDKRALYDRWQYVGQEARFKAISQTETTPISSRFISDYDLISGESISIGYESTGDWLKKIGASSLSFRTYMNDFFRISTVKNERGIDYPFARSVSFSLGLRF